MKSSYGLDAVNISFLPSEDGSSVKSLPLVVTPRWETSVSFLCSWCEHNREFLDDMMVKYGAILVRGFDVTSCSDFQSAVKSYQPKLSDSYRGTSPRNLQDGMDYVFSAADVPSSFPIAQHIEMSFLPAPPRQLFFGCMKAPASSGGETALCDFRKVYQELSPELCQKLLDKKIRYTRTHKKVGSTSLLTFDVADMKGWPELFETSSKEEVERICKEEGIHVSWEGPNEDTFVSVIESEPFQHHPVTKEPVWFNHTQVFHWTTFPAELFLAFLRTWDLRSLFRCILISIVYLIEYGILRRRMGLDATFGDGTPISVWEMHEIRSAIHKHMVYSRWAQGDMLLIDNFGVSHGRQPTYDRSRKIVVSWSDPMEKANTLTSEDKKVVADEVVVVSFENPQERTPESTLTKADAESLKEAMLDKRFEALNPQEIENAFATKPMTAAATAGKLHKRFRSQPLPLYPSSDFWKAAE